MVLQVKRSGVGMIIKEGFGILGGGGRVMVHDEGSRDDDNDEYVHDDEETFCPKI